MDEICKPDQIQARIEEESPNGLYRLLGAGEDRVDSNDYRWNNRERRCGVQEVPWVMQLTLSGEAFLEDLQGRTIVEKDNLMFFRYGDDSVYGSHKADVNTYHLRYIVVSGAQTDFLLEWLRQRKGAVLNLDPDSRPRQLYDAIFSCAESSERDRFFETSLIYQFFISLLVKPQDPRNEGDRLSMVNDIIENRFREPINVNLIADEVGWSREHLSREFRDAYGYTISERLRDRRLEEARYLLQVFHYDVTEIARRCGYLEQSTFVRAFRRKFGISPNSLRSDKGTQQTNE